MRAKVFFSWCLFNLLLFNETKGGRDVINQFLVHQLEKKKMMMVIYIHSIETF